LDQVSLEAPVAAFQQVSRDITLETKLALVGGTAARALDIQHRYRDFTAQVLGDLGGEERDLLERWSALLDGLEVDPHSVARQVEWVAKLQVLEALRARRGDSWAAPALRALDLQWTQVGGENPLFRRLENRGGVELLFSDAEVAAAVTEPPTSTRAYLKGQTLARFPEAVATAGWDSLTLVDASKPGRSGVVRVALPDPLGANQYQVGALLRQANSAHELEELLTQAGLT
jgi:proteasome accessory factor A